MMAAAVVFLHTPLYDGASLPPVEYAIWRGATGSPAVIVGSEFSGVGAVLAGAALVNPHNLKQSCTQLVAALEATPDEAVSGEEGQGVKVVVQTQLARRAQPPLTSRSQKARHDASIASLETVAPAHWIAAVGRGLVDAAATHAVDATTKAMKRCVTLLAQHRRGTVPHSSLASLKCPSRSPPPSRLFPLPLAACRM